MGSNNDLDYNGKPTLPRVWNERTKCYFKRSHDDEPGDNAIIEYILFIVPVLSEHLFREMNPNSLSRRRRQRVAGHYYITADPYNKILGAFY